MTRAIFWDNDGVLVDTEHLYYTATRDVLATAGIDLTTDDYIDLFLVQSKGAWHLAQEKGLPEEKVIALRRDRDELYRELLRSEIPVIDGVKDVLAQLRGRYVMGIVTSSQKEHFDVIHRSTGLLDHFDFVLTASDYTRFKPDPEPYLLALERSGCAPEDCVAIEDSERGLTAAAAAGIRCLVIPNGLTRGSSFAKAHKILSNVRELLDEL